MNSILEHRNFVAVQIEKSFGEEIDIEKAWNVGDEKHYQGKTYYVAALNAKGQPLWRLKKDVGRKEPEKRAKEPTQHKTERGIIKDIQKLVNKYNNLGYNGKYRWFDIKTIPNPRGGYDGIAICGVSKKFIDDKRFDDYAKELGFSFKKYKEYNFDRDNGTYIVYYDIK